MSKKTKISWCDATANHWQGCSKVSDGCKHCYAETRDRRYNEGRNWGPGMPRPYVQAGAEVLGTMNRVSRARRMVECDRCGIRWVLPSDTVACPGCGSTERRIVPARVFALSLGDWLDPDVPEELRAKAVQDYLLATNCDVMLLTKRPDRWLESMEGIAPRITGILRNVLDRWLAGDPPPNIAIGTTVENQAVLDGGRLEAMLGIPAARRFVSCEPLLGPIQFNPTDLRTIDLVVTGGESGAQARPCHPGWVLGLERQAHATGTAFHHKQWGEWAPCDCEPMPTEMLQRWKEGQRGNVLALAPSGAVALALRSPADVIVWRAGKRRAGAQLPTALLGETRTHQDGLPSIGGETRTTHAQAEHDAACAFWNARQNGGAK